MVMIAKTRVKGVSHSHHW